MAERLAPADARGAASHLIDQLRRGDASLLELRGADLGPALEQRLFIALRDGRARPTGAVSRTATRIAELAVTAGAGLAALVAGHARRPGAAPMVVLIREPVHLQVLRGIGAALQGLAPERLAVVRVGRAARSRVPDLVAPRLIELLAPRLIPTLVAHQAATARGLGRATAGWEGIFDPLRIDGLRQVAGRELPRIALGAIGLQSIVHRWQPSLLATFDEVGTWARLLPAVARSCGLPSLDLPHAEAADAIAIVGVGYDRMAVYGPRAAAVLKAAGVKEERVVQIGAPRFDQLAAAARHGSIDASAGPRRVLFAAQYVTGAMTMAGMEACMRAALAAAGAASPAELVVVPHPAEPRGLIAGIAARTAPPPGVRVRLEPSIGLQALLDGAWLLVTGWSNSIFEAAIAGVPSIAVSPAGNPPVDFAADGLALAAVDEPSAAAAARSMLDPDQRAAAVRGAHQAVQQRLGTLDGRASERAARLMLEMAIPGARSAGDRP